jgi:hypothetical protein
MIQLNWTIIIIATLVPTITGMIWYNPKVFGTAWMNLNGFTEEQMKGGSMAKMIISSIIFSFLITIIIHPIVIHQMAIYSVLANDPGVKGGVDTTTEAGAYLTNFFATYGDRFRTFKHGAFHGALTGIFLVLPLFGINGTFERKPFKLTLIHAGYWTLTLAIMGGLICQFT